MADADFSVAVFPFLKTSNPVRIGGYVFRSTEDVEGLRPGQARAIGEIAQMLFVQNDLRIKSASYAILPTALLKSEIKRKGVSYRELADHLTTMGIPESERNIANKISRGGFTVAFIQQCFAAIGSQVVRLEDMPQPAQQAS